MMQNAKLQVAVIGYGNIGKYALQAIAAAPDLELAGVVRRPSSLAKEEPELQEIPVAGSIAELGAVDTALLCLPSRSVPKYALQLAKQGINTVDSYDLHGDLAEYRLQLDAAAQAQGTVAVVAAGWDPGTNSLVRALMEVMAPRGLTFTNFGPGLSLGHSVAAAKVAGVRRALSFTIPKGAGLHRRLVYVELAAGGQLEAARREILADPYFQADETYVYQVESVDSLRDVGHGVLLERKGMSGQTGNQELRWEMRVNNPALTSQIMVAAARAGRKQSPGAYTMLQIPLIDYLFGEVNELIRRLV